MGMMFKEGIAVEVLQKILLGAFREASGSGIYCREKSA